MGWVSLEQKEVFIALYVCGVGRILPYAGCPFSFSPCPPTKIFPLFCYCNPHALIPTLCLGAGDSLILLGSQGVIKHVEAPFQVRDFLDVRYYLIKKHSRQLLGSLSCDGQIPLIWEQLSAVGASLRAQWSERPFHALLWIWGQ